MRKSYAERMSLLSVEELTNLKETNQERLERHQLMVKQLYTVIGTIKDMHKVAELTASDLYLAELENQKKSYQRSIECEVVKVEFLTALIKVKELNIQR